MIAQKREKEKIGWRASHQGDHWRLFDHPKNTHVAYLPAVQAAYSFSLLCAIIIRTIQIYSPK